MPHRRVSVLIALAAAGVVRVAAAAGSPPVAVQERPLVKSALPADAQLPMNVPEDGAVKMPCVSGGPPGVGQRINTAVWKAVLDGAAAPPSGFGQRELHGQLAGMAITMTLGRLREGVQQRGSYAYDKYRTPIPLLVSRDGSQVRALEGSASAGSFALTIAGGSLVGTWPDKDGRKRLPVIFQ